MLAGLEQISGLALIAVTLADVFLTVLYARAGFSLYSRFLAHGVRRLFLAAGKISGRHRARVLSFCGPSILVVLLVGWISVLAVGTAFIIHPALGTGVVAIAPHADGGFLTALMIAGSTMASVGPGPFMPVTSLYKLVFLANSFLGISVMTLAITYLMQLYTALQNRDELALKVELMTAQTGDAARFVAGLGPDGRFDTCYTILAEVAAELSRVKEAHHLYPVLFYFRFPQPFYELSRVVLVLLDSVAIIRAGVDDRAAGWLKRSGAMEHLERGALVLIETLHRVYLRGETGPPDDPTPGEAQAWRARFARATAVLQAAGVPIRRDAARCADDYVRMRHRWNDALLQLGGAIGHEPHEIDPALYETQPRRPPEPAEVRVLH